jgi:signal transduction histidine kinase
VAPELRLGAMLDPLWQLLGADVALLGRLESDGTMTCLARWARNGGGPPPGDSMRLGGSNVLTLAADSGQPSRMDDVGLATGPMGDAARQAGHRCEAAAPVVVRGQTWGVMAAASVSAATLPAETTVGLVSLSDLVATAIANAGDFADLAAEQAALRRVATLVARGVPEHEIFAVVTEEVGRLLGVMSVNLARYEPEGGAVVVGSWGVAPLLMEIGRRVPLDGANLVTRVAATHESARIDAGRHAGFGLNSPVDALAREREIHTAVGAPIVVDGKLWGLIGALAAGDSRMPPEAEERLTSFAELVGTSIANAESRAELTASRARLVAAGAEVRHRIGRDLHDGAQQRLVHAVITLKLALRALRNGDSDAVDKVAEALGHAEAANRDLRELAQGIMPAVLTTGGLRAAAEAVVSRVSIPVAIEVTPDRFGPTIEATAYFLVLESLTNAVKHARATRARVTATATAQALLVEVHDDGVGGARVMPASGLGGLRDRVVALGGVLDVDSPVGEGTTVRASLPRSSGA